MNDPVDALDAVVRALVEENGDRFLTGYTLIATHENMESDGIVAYTLASLDGQSHVATLGMIHAGLKLQQDEMFGDPYED